MNPALQLPNGMTCYLTSEAMRFLAAYARWEIFGKQRYLHPGFELRPKDVVVDIGGNVGMFMLWAAPQVPHGKVISIEPNPASFACMKLNAERNLLSNVSLMNVAAGRPYGTVQLLYQPGWEGIAYCAELSAPWFYTNSKFGRLGRWFLRRVINQPDARDPSQQEITVPRLSLGQIMDENKTSVIDYLKLDCEGSEFEILQNIELKYWAQIKRIAIEYHAYGSKLRRRDIINLLTGRGFHVETERSLMDLFQYVLGANVGFIWACKR